MGASLGATDADAGTNPRGARADSVAVFSKSNMSWMTEPRKPHVSGLSRRLPTSETSSSNTSGDGGFTQAQSKGHSTDPTSTGKKVLGKGFFFIVWASGQWKPTAARQKPDPGGGTVRRSFVLQPSALGLAAGRLLIGNALLETSDAPNA
jgi:hypothetical protein